jgi:hypothetical protein
MYRQFNIQHFYVLHTVYLYVLCGSQNRKPLFPYTALSGLFYNRDLNFCSPVVTICTANLTLCNSKYYTQCIYVFCVDLRTKSHYFNIQHFLGSQNRKPLFPYTALSGLFYNRDLNICSPVVII